MENFKKINQLIKISLQVKKGVHIYLYRHGQSMANHTGSVIGWTDSKLSIKGRQQSNKMFKVFYPNLNKFSSIHTSDLIRCRQSLNLSLGFSQRNIIQSKQLRQLNFGDLQGIHYDSMQEKQKKIMSSINYQAPNGENWLDVRNRAIKYISNLNQGHHLICTHGGLICSLSYHLGIKQVLPNCSIISMQFCGIKKDFIKVNFDWSFLQ